MGGFFAKALEKLVAKQDMRILMVGLDAAGKTTILYKLKLGDLCTTIPTIGFNVETIEYKNINFTCWDIGGQHLIRPLWKHYYHGSEAVIFVVDSNDRDRIDAQNGLNDDNACDTLHSMLQDDLLRDASLLVLANKQDLPQAMTLSELTDRLQLNKLKNRDWYIQSTVATTGDGLYEGLDWLSQSIKKKKSKNSKW